MKQFINLTSRVINKLYISEITKSPGKYYIHMNKNSFAGVIIFGFGHISGHYTIHEICEKEHKQDYDIITEFIKKID